MPHRASLHRPSYYGRTTTQRQQSRKAYDQARSKAHAATYGGDWQKLSKLFLRLNPFCKMCMANNRLTPADTVHHIVPIRDAPQLRLEITNLMALCHSCHSRHEARYSGFARRK